MITPITCRITATTACNTGISIGNNMAATWVTIPIIWVITGTSLAISIPITGTSRAAKPATIPIIWPKTGANLATTPATIPNSGCKATIICPKARPTTPTSCITAARNWAFVANMAANSPITIPTGPPKARNTPPSPPAAPLKAPNDGNRFFNDTANGANPATSFPTPAATIPNTAVPPANMAPKFTLGTGKCSLAKTPFNCSALARICAFIRVIIAGIRLIHAKIDGIIR
ncbi:hypothetical protein [Cutibacterium phage PAVL21]|nr:hypothetical protein [Cutibacterium phage PAVL21]